MKKICLCICLLLSLSKGAHATIGIGADIRFPNVTFRAVEAHDCSYDALIDTMNKNKEYITYVNDLLGSFLASKKGRLSIYASSHGSEEQNYSLEILFKDGKELRISDCEILNKEKECRMQSTIDKKIFYQFLIDFVSKELGIKKGLTVKRQPFLASGYTVQLGLFLNNANALKFAKQSMSEMNEKSLELDLDAGLEIMKDYDSFCEKCLINDEFGDGWAYPPVFIAEREGKFTVNYGVFTSERDAINEIKRIRKFYKGEFAIKQIKLGADIIKKQIDHRWYESCPRE